MLAPAVSYHVLQIDADRGLFRYSWRYLHATLWPVTGVIRDSTVCHLGREYSHDGALSYRSLRIPTGFYAGYLGSAYMFGRFVGGYALGRIADCVGRKPVMISGLLSIAAFSMTFGLSPSFAAAIASR